MRRSELISNKIVNLSIDVDVDDLMEAILSMACQHKFDPFVAVCEIDERMADWGFTKRCFEHFQKMMKDYTVDDDGEESC